MIIGYIPQNQGALLMFRDTNMVMQPERTEVPMFAEPIRMSGGKFTYLRVSTPDTVLRAGGGNCSLNETDFARSNETDEVEPCPFDLFKKYCKADFDLAADRINGIEPQAWMTESLVMLSEDPAVWGFFVIEVIGMQRAIANDYARIAWLSYKDYPVGSTNLSVTLAGAAASYDDAPLYYDLNQVRPDDQPKVNTWLNGYRKNGKKIAGIFRCNGYLSRIVDFAVPLATANTSQDLIYIDTNNGSAGLNVYNHELIIPIMRKFIQANRKLNKPNQADAPFFVLPDSIFQVFKEALAATGQGTVIPFVNTQTGATGMNGATIDFDFLDGFKVYRYSPFDNLADEMGAIFDATINGRQRRINRNALVLFMKPRSLQPFSDTIGTRTVNGQDAAINIFQPQGSAQDLHDLEVFLKTVFAFGVPDPNNIVAGWASDTSQFL